MRTPPTLTADEQMHANNGCSKQPSASKRKLKTALFIRSDAEMSTKESEEKHGENAPETNWPRALFCLGGVDLIFVVG